MAAVITDPLVRSGAYARYAELFSYPAPGDDDGPSGAEHVEAFDPSVSKRACSLRESGYIGFAHEALLEELVRFYSYFGLRRIEDSELPDHLTVELEFMHYLTHLEYKARERGEDPDGLRRAQFDFLTRHVSRVAVGLCEGYRGDSRYYRALVDELSDFVMEELEELTE